MTIRIVVLSVFLRLKVAAAKAAAEAATTNDSLRGELEKLKAEKESLEESITELSLQIETIYVPIDPNTTQCNTDDGTPAFDVCRYSELKVQQDNVCRTTVVEECLDGYERNITSLGAELKEFLVDCDNAVGVFNGRNRITGVEFFSVTCEEACDGQCCAVCEERLKVAAAAAAETPVASTCAEKDEEIVILKYNGRIANESRAIVLEELISFAERDVDINDQRIIIIKDLAVQICSQRCTDGGIYQSERDYLACSAGCKESWYGTTEIEPVWYVDDNNELAINEGVTNVNEEIVELSKQLMSRCPTNEGIIPYKTCRCSELTGQKSRVCPQYEKVEPLIDYLSENFKEKDASIAEKDEEIANLEETVTIVNEEKATLVKQLVITTSIVDNFDAQQDCRDECTDSEGWGSPMYVPCLDKCDDLYTSPTTSENKYGIVDSSKGETENIPNLF